MIVFPAEWSSRKEAVFAALAKVGKGGRRLPFIPLSFKDFPETSMRTDAALSRAKRQPKSALVRCLKRLLIRGQYNWARRYFLRNPNDIAVAWNGLTGSRVAFLAGAKDANAATLYAELAPFPDRITLDPIGVNAESSIPQDPQFYRDWLAQNSQPKADHWRDMGKALVARPSRRADVGQSTDPLPDTPFIFCPLQVPDDSQVTLFAGWSGGMAGFLAALATAASALPPNWHLRIKEHPSAKTPLTELIAPLLSTGRVVLDNQTDSFAQIAAARAVVTLNSSMGLQAFFHDKPVITVGRAFFALSGLTVAAQSQDQLNQAFATPEALGFDQDLRGAFMAWLDTSYYPGFSPGPPPRADLAAFAQKLGSAQIAVASRVSPLSPSATIG